MKSQLIKKIITGDEIRNAFLEFYSEKLHKIIPSASLIPDDPTVMLTIAGMLQAGRITWTRMYLNSSQFSHVCACVGTCMCVRACSLRCLRALEQNASIRC